MLWSFFLPRLSLSLSIYSLSLSASAVDSCHLIDIVVFIFACFFQSVSPSVFPFYCYSSQRQRDHPSMHPPTAKMSKWLLVSARCNLAGGRQDSAEAARSGRGDSNCSLGSGAFTIRVGSAGNSDVEVCEL